MATHKELITSGKFDEKFKRALLDYYSYGFKNLGSFDEKRRQTLSEDWLRLNRVIVNYMEWSKNRNEIMFASVDSQSMDENPFHRVYRFCKYKPFIYPAYFLHTIAALSHSFTLREGVDALELDDDPRMHLEDLLDSDTKLKTSDLIYFYTENLAPATGDDRNKTPNNRLNDLEMIGLVECEQYDGAVGGKGDRRWSLPELTMRKILDSGETVNADFAHHFFSALDFFSKYYLFGEVGTFLRDRICSEEVSPFRFKHEYFMQSLNDFNLIDLLYAIENKKWCKVKYSHGIADFSTEILCYPLEIRISNMNGREFLMYYEPFHRSYTALRIEFIDSIEFYDDKKIRTVLSESEFHYSSDSIDSDIKNARDSLQYSWGVATTKIQDNNTVNPIKAHNVSLRIAYTPETDYYIANRLKRECRFGNVLVDEESHSISFSVGVSDEVELRPWIRSFYSRIISCSGMVTDTFSLDEDVERIVSLLLHDKVKERENLKSIAKTSRWTIPDSVLPLLGSGTKARAHDLLFNEAFSVYYYIIADVFVQLCSGSKDGIFTDSDIYNIISCSFGKYYVRAGEETEDLLPSEIKELLINGGFLKKTTKTSTNEYEFVRSSIGGGFNRRLKEMDAYLSKYKCDSGVELYRDVVPLSVMELRWLKTILCDESNRIKLFLSEEEIAVIKNLLNRYATEISAIPMEKIKYFDRFHFPKTRSENEASVLATLLEGIYDQKTVQIKYRTMKRRVMIGEFRPIVLEFSKRNNRFQGFLQDCKSDRIYTLNVDRIESATETDASFDYSAAEQAFAAFRENNTTMVEIEFFDSRNIADRILTEFSPWKKRCSFDTETGLYKLTVFYQKQDEIDLVIRLLGYGATIRFTDKNHPIYKEILARMNQQMDLIREQRKLQRDKETGVNR